MSDSDSLITRRKFIKLTSTALAAAPVVLSGATSVLAADRRGQEGGKKRQDLKIAKNLVRVASVSTAVEGGVLPHLVKSFMAETGIEVALTSIEEPYLPAGKGMFDLVIAHFGHRDTERFVMDGLGRWPRTVFSNQLALFGPTTDPAKVRGLSDLVLAFSRIARAGVPYILNDTRGIRYLTEIVWRAAGKPPKGAWYIDNDGSKRDAVEFAAKHGGYVIWGLTPFIREQKAAHLALQPLVTADPILQRIMVSVVINPDRVPGVNADGASKFQEYLLSPAAQAKMLDIHYPGIKQAVWAPAGRNNATRVLPD